MNDVVSLLNHTCAAPLRVVGKERHNISSRGCYRLKVVLKVMIWSNGSFRPLNDSSCGRQNFRDQGHSRTFAVKGKSVILTIPSKFRSVFSLIAFLSSSISFLISLRRPEFTSSEEFSHQLSSLLWLSSSLFLLVPTLMGEQFSSCCSCSLIS